MSYVGSTVIYDGSGNPVSVVTRPITGVKALSVSIGPTDPISDLPVIVPYDHHQLHEGEMFQWSVYISNLASNASKDIRLVVPLITTPVTNEVTRCPHFRLSVEASVGGLVYLSEGSTYSANGTQRTPVAMERNGTYTSKLQVWEDPTVSTLGTLLWQSLLTGTRQSTGDSSNSNDEFILKNNTSYHIRFTSSGNSNQVLIHFVWYEDLGV